MQTKTNKSYGALLLGVVALFAMLVLFICLPHTVKAAELGSEQPYIYCTYTDADGKEVDGNTLKAGAYDVSIMLEGVSDLSVIQVTASYTSGATVATTPSALLTDAVSDMASMGYVLTNGNIVFGFVSNNDECSAINAEGMCLATIRVTFASDCDAADIITINTNPNMTFIQTNYNDGYDDSYALVDTFQGYSGILYPMTADVTPELATAGYSVSGNLVIMTDNTGATAGYAVAGEYTVNVYSDADRTDLVTSVTSVESTENNKKLNSFVIDELATGTYYLTITSDFAIARNDITLNVGKADIDAGNIPIIACNFNGDGFITGADVLKVYEASARVEKDLRFDLNRDSEITSADTLLIYACAKGSLSYKSITIE